MISENIPLGSNTNDAPWNEQPYELACPACKSELVRDMGDYGICTECTYQALMIEFVEQGEIEKQWRELDYEDW